MQHDHTEWLIQQIVGTAELLGHEIKPSTAFMLADDLSAYPRAVLARAMQRVRSEHAGRLTPKAILDRIDEVMGRPAANEAWAVAVQALDERATVVWTEEIAQAWGAALPIASGGDLVGARMAFISTYERLVRTAREERRLPAPVVSIGWDQEARAAGVEKAVQLGYVPPDHALHLLEAPAETWVEPLALLTGNVEPTSSATPEVLARLAELRAELANRPQRTARSRVEAVEAQVVDLDERKRSAQARTEQFLQLQAQRQGEQA